MYSKIVIITCILAASTLGVAQAKQLCIGSIAFPCTVKRKNPVYFFYGTGDRIIARQGVFQFYENEQVSTLNILIAEEAHCISDEETEEPLYWEIKSDTKARYFRLSYKGDKDSKFLWSIKEEAIKKYPFKAPLEYTLVILMPAYWVKELKQEPWEPKNNVIKLPTIVLDETLSQKTIEKGLSYACLDAINHRTFHSEVEYYIKHQGLTTIAYNKY